MINQTALVGTNKGLIEFNEENDRLIPGKVHFKGFSVTMIFIDSETWWVGLNHRHWGPKLHRSDNQGRTWEEKNVPGFGNLKLSNGKDAILRQIWVMSRSKDTLWMGTDPGGLFKSTNEGKSFELVESLWNHPSRGDINQWFGAGSDFPFLHTIEPHPTDDNLIFVGVSSAGVFATTDHGKTWEPRNKGLKATYLPNNNVEIGHDPHAIKICSADPDVIWQQNHCGVYISKDRAQSWTEVSGKNGIPGYGFALAIDHEDPARAWVIPAESDDQRNAPDLNLRVFKTEDFGTSWQIQDDGLPDFAFDIVLRQAFEKSDNLMLFGTNSGNLYQSFNAGNNWSLVSSNLTKINVLAIVPKD